MNPHACLAAKFSVWTALKNLECATRFPPLGGAAPSAPGSDSTGAGSLRRSARILAFVIAPLQPDVGLIPLICLPLRLCEERFGDLGVLDL